MTDIQVVALPGDGTGPEVMEQALRVLELVGPAADVRFDVREIPCGGKYYLEHGRDWPEGSEEACKNADVVLLGAVGWPSATGGPVTMKNGKMAGWSPVIGNRLFLDLYANVRPVKLYKGVQHRIHGRHKQVWEPGQVDMVIIRENTEDLYCGAGGLLAPGGVGQVAIDNRIITRTASEKVIRFAFELARRRDRGAPKDGKKRLTAVVKDNVMEGCRFFAQIFREIGREYPDIEQETAIVDAFTQWLIGQPEHYDVVVTTNMFGDIVTDLASVLQGGMGMAVGCNLGNHHAMFEPIHGSAPKHAGLDKVNLMAMLLAVGEALRWVGQRRELPALAEAAAALEASIEAVLEAGGPLTYDLVGEERAARASEVTTAVLHGLQERLPVINCKA